MADNGRPAKPPNPNTEKQKAIVGFVARILAETLSIEPMRASEVGDLETPTRLHGKKDAENSSDSGIKPCWRSVLLHLLKILYEKTGELYHLQNAISFLDDVESPPNDTILDEMVDVLVREYTWLKTAEDPQSYMVWATEAVATIPLNHPNAGIFLDGLARKAYDNYERSKSLEDLEQAIKRSQGAVSATSLAHPHRGPRLGILASYTHQRYVELGDLGDLEQAILFNKDSVAEIRLGHPNRSIGLANMALYIYERYLKLGSLDDLQEVIKFDQDAVAAAPPLHSSRARALFNQAHHLHGRYERLGGSEDLDDAIRIGVDAIAAALTCHPNREGILTSVAGYFYERYELLGALDDLGEAIRIGRDAIVATPLSSPTRETILVVVAGYLYRRYEHLGALEDLEQAIQLSRNAVGLTPPGHPERLRTLNNLACCLYKRYERLGVLADLDQLITVSANAVVETPDVDCQLAYRLRNYAAYYHTRYERLGTLDDHEKAIQLSDRHLRLGAREDIEKAIKLGGDTVSETPVDHPYRQTRSINLATYFHQRYLRLGTIDDLEQAIKLGRDVVDATPLGHPEQASRLNSLATYMNCRYMRSGVQGDLEESIKFIEDAVASTPLDHPNRATITGNLGAALHNRYSTSRDLGDLEQAIKQGEDAVAISPSDHQDQVLRWTNLGVFTTTRFLQTHSRNDVDEILQTYRKAWDCKLSRPRDRIHAALSAGTILALIQDWQESLSLLEGAVRLLQNVVPLRVMERDDQENILSRFTQLAAEAASVALQAGKKPSHCLQLLELGRGIIMGLAIDCRSDLSELRAGYPDLFDKLSRLRTEIDTPLVNTLMLETERGGYEPSAEQNRTRRLQAISEMEENLDHIRRLPGFEGFQLPPSSEDLMAIAVEGPIVILNSTRYRSDALIVKDSDIKALALPDLLYSDVTEWMKCLAQGLTRGKRSTYPERSGKLEKLLLWLWNVAVEPVLKELGLTGDNSDGSRLTRIWWIGIGPLATAPFHAAGDYLSQHKVGTMDRVISSYIPTIKALSYARQKKFELLRSPDSCLLLVTMPTTPGQRALRGAIKEVEEIATTIAGTTITSTRLDSPSAAGVLGQLPQYHAIHFACHGIPVPKNPSSSHLLLYKDKSTPDKLTVGAISGANIQSAQLAYLSACCTADNSSVDLADESIHIASGFQLAGFSHVLATMWDSSDIACRQVSGDFYRLLFDGQGSRDHQKVSTAFHHAVKKLRDQNLDQPIKWASYIHTGA